jgi:hypothetical protein
MSAWSDRRVRWVALAVAGLYALGPLFLLADGGTEAWMLLVTLAFTPLIVVWLPIWFSIAKGKTDDQDRLRIIVEVTAWPSLIAMYITFVIMGIVGGLKIAGTTGAVIGALVIGIFFGLSISGERRLHHQLAARLRGEPVDPAPRASIGRWAIAVLSLVGSVCLTAAFGYALGGVAGAVAITLATVLLGGLSIGIGLHRRRKLGTSGL